MTDEELIKWLRNLEPMDYELRHGTFQTAAADRIEQLAAKLAKAADVLRELVTCVDDGCYCSEMKMASVMDTACEVLAELEK